MLCIKAVEHIVRLSTTKEYVVPLAFEHVVKLTVIAVTLLLSFATAAQLCYRRSALLPLLSFATLKRNQMHSRSLDETHIV